MKGVLIACEFSGVVREAFRARGFDAWSCDLLPAEDGSRYHLQRDVREVLSDTSDWAWDLMIAHPPCTYLCNSGVAHLHSVPSKNGVLPLIHGEERWAKMREGAELFRALLDAPINRIAVENPIPHKYAVEAIGRKYDQRVQPWYFGHGETKATCFWLKNLPPLMDTVVALGREQRLHKLPKTANRAKLRSVTYPGIAAAMAEQWGASL